MHRKLLIAGLLMLIPVLAFAQTDPWTFSAFEVNIPADDGFVYSSGAFGIVDGATDGYERDVDVASPPCSPSGACVFFPCTDMLVTQLSTDMRGIPADGDTIIWDINITGNRNPGTFDWESASLPTEGTFLVHPHYPMVYDWSTATDMRSASSVSFALAQQVSIMYIPAGGATEDTTPPEITELVPANGATSVDPSTNVVFEIIDPGSGIDLTTLSVSVDDMDITTMVPAPSSVTDGYRWEYDPIMDLPAGDHEVLLSICDNADPANCLTDYSWTFTVTGTAPDTFRISGTVALSDGATPVDATVTAILSGIPAPIDTDEDGNYSMVTIVEGDYLLVASKTGYVTSDTTTVHVDATTPEVTDIDFTLDPVATEEYSLYGTVTDAVTSDELADVEIALDDTYTGTSETSGTYLIESIEGGTYTITATLDGYEPFSDEITISADRMYDIALTPIVSTYNVNCTFELEDMGATEGISVTMTPGGYEETTDADGMVSFTGVANGDYTVSASYAGYTTYTEEITVDGADATVTGTLNLSTTELGAPTHCVASNGNLYSVVVQWEPPLESGLIELSYDDGVADREPGGYTHIGIGGDPSVEWGVQFTPPTAGCEIVTIKYAFLIDTPTASVDITLRDMVADTPADELIPTVTYEIDTVGEWKEFEIGYDLTDDDDFYVGFRDVVVGTDTSAIYIGCDKNADPDLRSWINMDGWDLVNNMTFDGLPESDLMIRAIVRTPSGALVEIAPSDPTFGRARVIRDQNPNERIGLAIEPSIKNPFMVAGELQPTHRFSKMINRTKPVFARELEEMEVGYNIYRSDESFSDVADAELIASVDTATTWFVDTTVVDLVDELTWAYYAITMYDDEDASESPLSNVDSGFYREYAPEAEVLLIDRTGAIPMANLDGSDPVSETQFLYDQLLAIGYEEDEILRTDSTHALYWYNFNNYEYIVIAQAMAGDRETAIENLTDGELLQLYDYLDNGGKVYFEGCVAAYRLWFDSEDFETYFGYEHGFEDGYIGHDSDSGNVMWVETVDEDLYMDGVYIQMDHLGFGTYVDFRNSQLEPLDGAATILRSQPDGEGGIPVEYSRGRMIYNELDSDAKTVFSSVYIGALGDEDYPTTKLRLFNGVMKLLGTDRLEGVSENIAVATPEAVTLHSNYPNPFNSTTEISFDLNEASNVSLDVFDINGKLISNIANGTFTAGTHVAKWDGKDTDGNEVTSGVYLYKLSTETEEMTRRMLYVR